MKCPECGMDYNEDDDCQGGFCGSCGWHPSFDMVDPAEAAQSFAETIVASKKIILGTDDKTAAGLWLIKKGRKKAISTVDRKVYKAALVLDGLIFKRFWSPDVDEDLKGENHDCFKAIKHLQGLLDKTFKVHGSCVCRPYVFTSYDVSDDSGYCDTTLLEDYLFIIIESKIHKNQSELLSDIITGLIGAEFKAQGLSFESRINVNSVARDTYAPEFPEGLLSGPENGSCMEDSCPSNDDEKPF